MVSRKKRSRYKTKVKELSKIHGFTYNPESWEDIWNALDKYDEPVYLYAIGDKQNGLVKFGRSVNPGQRLKTIKTGNALDISLWAFCVESDDLCEKTVHKTMEKHRIGGEWFRLNNETYAVVDKIRAKAGYQTDWRQKEDPYEDPPDLIRLVREIGYQS